MKCECRNCDGSGVVHCPECDGAGGIEEGIEIVTLHPTMNNYKELDALQQDARRAIRQAERLKALNPARADRYAEQLRGCLAVINRQADEAAKAPSRQ